MPIPAKPAIDVAELAFNSSVKRAVELAQSRIVSILGRKPFTQVRVGCTDVKLGNEPQTRKGFVVNTLYTSPSPRATQEVARQLATWLRTCHGQRFADAPETHPVKTGDKVVFLAVQEAATAAAAAAGRPGR